MKMNQEQAKQYIKDQLKDYLTTKGININKPFNCLNPLHNDKKPSMSYDKKRNKCHCFSCDADYDTFDIISNDYGTSGNDTFLKAYELYGIEIESNYKMPIKQVRIERHQEEPKTDTKELELLNNSLQNKDQAIEFLNTNRGINKEYLKTLTNIGYYTDTTNKFNNTYLTIKTSDASFIRRNIDTKNNFRFKNYGHNRPSKLELLKMPEPVIVVESYIDLMSIESIGYKAICLNSVANYSAFLDYIDKNKNDIKASIILCLDKDQAGKDTTEIIRRELEKTSITFFIGTDRILSYTGQQKVKDINDLLKANTEILKTNIENTIDAVKERATAEFETKKREWEKDKVINYIPIFINDIETKADNCIKTGYKQLDKILDGGLYPGLYTIGAISSIGKTNFILQMSDQIAQAGHQVLYFSLEMSKAELIARSISRITYQTTNVKYLPKSTREILKFSNYQNYNKEQIDHIDKAINIYKSYASNININEGIGDITIGKIRQKIKDYIYFTGKAPVVFIDYLQLLALNPDNNFTDIRQIVDKSILELKRLSRDYETPIVVVSSFNRENYKKTANMGSFKESGAIEYSSDVLISLEYKKLDELKENQDIIDLANKEYEENGQNYKSVRLKVIKNRCGLTKDILLHTNGKYSIFEEIEQIPEQ